MSRTPEQLAAIAAFADALPVAIWVGRAPSGECVYVNREFERVLGITPPTEASRGNYVGPYSVHLHSGEPYPESQMPYERVMRARGPVVVDDLVIHRHDGAKTYLRVFASPILDARGEIAFVVEGFTDITREIEAERQRRESDRQVQIALRLESVGSLAGGIAHDFNNLLSIVKLTAANLREGETDSTRLELIGDLDEVAGHAKQLTRALLGFAQRQQGSVAPVNVHDLVRGVTTLARRTFERRILVASELEASLPTVLGDSSQLDQILMNLVMNARDAIEGDGRITLRTRDVLLGEKEHSRLPKGRYVSLEIQDTGKGIEPAIRERIFEPYFTTKTSGPVKGTGLGLATVYGLAQTHGGVVEVAASVPGATTMRVLLPVSEPATVEAPAASEEASVVRGSGTLLVVDDEPLVLKSAVRLLRGLGYDVLSASRGNEALRLLRRELPKVSAAVLDLSMPELSGHATFLALRDLAPHLPVVLTTGGAVEPEVKRLLERPDVALLSKPYSEGDLSATLAGLLSRRGAVAE